MVQKEKESKGKGSGVVVSIVIIVAVVLIILGISLFSNKNANSQNETSEENQESPQENTSTEISEPTEHIVEITLEGFVPKNLEIKKGEKVTWINKLATKSWVAGNFHPTHTNYPGSSAIKCGTAEEKNIFDSCRELQKGESYSFVFNEVNGVGGWGYHNHLQPSKSGKIVVS